MHVKSFAFVLIVLCPCVGFSQNREVNKFGDPLYESYKFSSSSDVKAAVERFKKAEDDLDREYTKTIKELEKSYAEKFEGIRSRLSVDLDRARTKAAATDFNEAKFIEKLQPFARYRAFSPFVNRSLMDSRHGEMFSYRTTENQSSSYKPFESGALVQIAANKLVKVYEDEKKETFELIEIGNGHIGFVEDEKPYVLIFTNDGNLIMLSPSANEDATLDWNPAGVLIPRFSN